MCTNMTMRTSSSCFEDLFTIRVGEEDVELREEDTLIIPPDTVHAPVSAGAEGCELIGMLVTNIRSFQPDGSEIGVGFESLR